MLVSLVAAMALVLPPTTQVEDPAMLVPADTLVYFGTHSVRAGSEAFSHSAMRAILDEPEVKAFFEKPVSTADKVVRQVLSDEGVAAERAERLSLARMMAGGETAPVGKVFFALTHVVMPTADAQQPDVGLVVGVELLEADDLAMLKALWGKLDLPEETAEYKGHEVFRKTGKKGMAISLSFVGNLAVVSLSPKSMEAVLDRASEPGGSSLANSEEYAKLVTTAGGLRPGASTWMVRMAPVAVLARGMLSMALAEQGQDTAQKAVSILDGLGLDGLTWLGGVGHRDAGGRVHGTTCVQVNPDAKGLVPKLVGMGEALDPNLPKRVPAGALGMGAGSLNWLPAVYDFAMGSFEAVAPDEYAQVQEMIKQFMGESDLREDLLANVHGTFMNYSLPAEGITGTPTGIVRFKVHDADRFVKALGSLVSSAAAMAGEPSVALKESSHEGHRMFELDLSSTGMGAMMMLSPAFAVDGDEMVFSLQSPTAVKTALNGVTGPTLADNAAFMGFVKGLSSKGELSTMSFMDNAATFSAGYTQVAGMAQMFAAAAGDLPVDLALLPSDDAISKHLQQSYTGGYVADGGRVHVSVSEGQFQVSDFLPIVMTGAVLGVAAANDQDVFAVSVEQGEEDPHEVVQKHLAEISAGMTVYKIAEGQFPDAINDLVKPLADYPQGCLGKPDVPSDPWGQPYHYKLNAKGRPFLWSSGPDGVDQGGEGDDIVKG